jgi:signal transduction histidine kinase
MDQTSVSFGIHALTNLLTLATASVDIVQDLVKPSPDDARLAEYLLVLEHSIDMMVFTVTRLTGMSGLQGANLRMEAINLPLLVQRIATYYRPTASRKQILLDADPRMEAPPVRGDPVVTRVVLGNLVSNALKYSPLGGRVWVELRPVGDWVQCDVRDEGPGLSEEDQARLFQRGARLSPRPTGGEPSNGFGLAVAKEMLDMAGGEIFCVSRLGAGSCFSFRLPIFRERTTTRHPLSCLTAGAMTGPLFALVASLVGGW